MNPDKNMQNAESSLESPSHRVKYLNLLLDQLTSPVQKRLVGTYQKKSDPVKAMEAELGDILTEILDHED